MSRVKRAHGFVALRVEGAILPPEFLREIAAQKARHQTEEAYRISRSLQLKDELGRYWHIARDHWKLFQQRQGRADLDQNQVSTAFLIAFFREVLGYYDLEPVRGAVAEGRHFAITHQSGKGRVPFLVVPHRFTDLDKAEQRFGEEGRRRSPANLMQEYLNTDERVQWGFVSNGNVIRLYRDNPSLTRPAFIEVDLALMLTDEIYADFTAMWLLLHDSRLRREAKGTGASILEQWRLQAHETGERALQHLREGVTEAMRRLGSGFLSHRENDGLLAKVESGELTAQEYYQQLLRLVYRLLFLFTVEDRNLLHAPKVKVEKRALYAEGYSLGRLRELALRRSEEGSYSDRWQALQILFSGLAGEEAIQDALGLPALDGLFSTGQCPDLDAAQIANGPLLAAIRALAYFPTESGLARINYRDMGAEELGSVYEGLLELHPQFLVEARPWTFGFVSDAGAVGSERKSTGSYYTPASLVDELIKSALRPVMAKAVEKASDPRQAILDLKVIDPACGSGHFLLAAAREMAAEIARLESDGTVPDEQVRQRALREVVRHCIYGVDKNPLAVELCRAALWMETIEPGKPLSFLDSHIQVGDSLIGLRDPAILKDGIPDEAYTALTGDEKAAERELKRRNRGNVYELQQSFFSPVAVASQETDEDDVETMPEETLADLNAKRASWLASRRRTRWLQEKDAADLFVAAFFLPKRLDSLEVVPVTEDLARLNHRVAARPGVLEAARRVAVEHAFFHWHLAFPQVMKRGGFDVVLGNPPWERVSLKEEEFFAARSPAIAAARNKAERERLIKALVTKDAKPAERALHAAFEQAKHDADAASLFLRKGTRYPLTGVGDVNTYAVFSEHALNLVGRGGRAGIIVPSGIVTDDSCKQFFERLIQSETLVSVFDFRNKGFFPGAASAQGVRFCLLTLLGEGGIVSSPRFAFRLSSIEDLSDTRRQFRLAASDIDLFNPNTHTCPVFRSVFDAELTKKIYKRVPVLINEVKGPGGNPWNLSFLRMLDMANDSKCFYTVSDLLEKTMIPNGVVWTDIQSEKWVPLYEAKMIHQFEHRYGDYALATLREGKEVRQLPQAREEILNQASYEVTPRYWVPERVVDTRVRAKNWTHQWLIGWRDVTSALDERTVIAAALPLWGVGHKFLLMLPSVSEQRLYAALLGNLNSLVLDYVARQKLGGTSLSYYVLKQLPILFPSAYSELDSDYVVPRVLELTYTSESMRPFAQEMGYQGAPFPWDPERRALLRAELDAFYAHKYGLTRDELRYILDPADFYGPEYPSETFRGLKENEIKEFGEYRTQRLVLEAWDRLYGTA